MSCSCWDSLCSLDRPGIAVEKLRWPGQPTTLTRMARKDEKIEHLKQVRLFSQCTKKELDHIARISDETAASQGSILTEEGTRGLEFFLILEGEASVKKGDRKVATLGKGAYFGELSLLDQWPRSATVVAETDMELLVVHRRDFTALIHDVPGLAYKLLVSTAARLREADAKSHY